MNITVKYFASLREQQGKSEETVNLEKETTIFEVWESVSGSNEAENVLMAINMEHVKPNAIVKDGDEVAFFPPVTGG